jgi:hypothetical protein
MHMYVSDVRCVFLFLTQQPILVALDWTAVITAQKKLKLCSEGGSCGTIKCARGSTYGGVWRSLVSGGRLRTAAFGRNLASVAVKMFSHV